MGVFPSISIPPLVNISSWSPESLNLASNSNFASGAFPSANRALFIPFLLFQTTTFINMFSINGSTASGNIDLGIYDPSGTKIVSTGTTAQTGTSTAQVISISPTELAPGQYYMAVALDNGTGTLFRITTGDASTKLQAITGIAQMASAFVLPASATLTNAASDYIPLIGLTTRSFV